MAGLIDPTKAGKYPVVLGDSLLGKTSNDIFTGIRYNHKPDVKMNESTRARLKPSAPGQTTSFDLSIPGKDGRPEYAFNGTRNTEDGQYVLYFDVEREVFVLDRIDSTFHMNITREPGDSNVESLAQKYPQLALNDITSAAAAPGGASSKLVDSKKEKAKPKPKAKPRAKSPLRKKDPPLRKPTKKQQQQHIELALPKVSPPKPKSKANPVEEDDEEEEEDDNGGLLLEYPDGDPREKPRNFNSPAFPAVRRFDDFMDQRESGGEDADIDIDNDTDTRIDLPSPVKHHVNSNNYHNTEPVDPDVYDPEHDDDEDDNEAAEAVEAVDTADAEPEEDDLEKMMEAAFEADESDISEED